MNLIERLRTRPAPGPAEVSIKLGPELSSQLRRAALARGRAPSLLARELLVAGLEQAERRAQAQHVLHALTARQQEVTKLIARGLTNRQIAAALVVSPETVKTHIRHILERFGASSKADLRVLLLDLKVRWWEADDGSTAKGR